MRIGSRKGAEVQVVNFTSICTSFTYQDMKKYDKIYQDKVLGEMARILEIQGKMRLYECKE